MTHDQRVEHWGAIGDWANTLPENAWTIGPPQKLSRTTLYAVRTETGRILCGTGLAFSPSNCEKIAAMEKYGAVVKHVEAGD